MEKLRLRRKYTDLPEVISNPKEGDRRRKRYEKGTRIEIWVTCPICKIAKWKNLIITQTPKYTGLCHRCRTIAMHKKRALRPINERPRTKRKDGYLELVLPDWHWCYPMATKSRHSILIHRLIMAEHLHRLLESWELIHHKNGVKDDNRIENLKITTRKDHDLTFAKGYDAGFKAGSKIKIDELRKEIRLLRWELKQVKESRFGV